MSGLKPIVVSAGEPAGIGPDLCCFLAMEAQIRPWYVVADQDLLRQRAQQLNLDIKLITLNEQDPVPVHQAGTLYVRHIACAERVTTGKLCKENAAYVLACLDQCILDAQSGLACGILTAPVHKGVINDAGIEFSGHTEYLQHAAGVERVVMVLATDTLRVGLVTTHLPLRAVADAITEQALSQTLVLFSRWLEKLCGHQPRILVCGLNPHAGEDGHLGLEEIEVINPTLKALQAQGYLVSDALPADTLFAEHQLKDADGVMAMYHDQGLPVLKHRGFGRAVNITLGLPFLRVSVDHGTALPLAGTGQINLGSMQTAFSTIHRSQSEV